MSDNKRFDLSSDLDQLTGDLLRDVQAAAESEKKRQEEIRTRGSRTEEKARSKKQSMLIVVVATVALLLTSYWWVFGRESNQEVNNSQPIQQQRVVINQPNTVQPTPQAPKVTPSQGQQVTEHPPTEYDQPSEDPEM